jgi:small-conductance mechanosensitive channel
LRWLETTTFLDVALLDWLIAGGIALAVFSGLLLVKRLTVRYLARIAGKTATGADDLVLDLARRTRLLLLLIPSVYAGVVSLEAFPRATGFLRAATVLAVLLQVALWASVAIDFWVAREKRRRLEQDVTTATLIGILRFVLKVVLWSILLLLALDNLGVDVTTLVAGLGVGGIAVALALQNILGDLLASLSIILDKPFVVGDAIGVDEFSGKVENIGLKTTRVRSLGGEQIVFSNGELLKSRIRNWSRLAERRVVLTFGILPAPAATVEKVSGLLRGAIEGRDRVRFDRAHFKGLGASSLDFEAVYWITSSDYNLFMDRQQEVNLAVLRILEGEGVEIAGPSRVMVTMPAGEASQAKAGAKKGKDLES